MISLYFTKGRTMIQAFLAQAGAAVSSDQADPRIPTNEAGQFTENLHHMANYFAFTQDQFHAVSHILTLGFGVFAAALFYFVLTIKDVAPKYRLSNVLSCVVSISALLILANQAFAWQLTFVYDGTIERYVRRDGFMFSNGFRYMNWAIDVPHLLLQMLVVLPLVSMAKKWSYGVQFVVAGLIMIIVSWIGAFFETYAQVEGVSGSAFWLNEIIGWIAYLYIVYIVIKVVQEAKQNVADDVKGPLNAILGVLIVSWTIYGVLLFLPAIWWSAESVVTRQVMFTVADITSKAIYGVILSVVAAKISKHEGFNKETQQFENTGGAQPATS